MIVIPAFSRPHYLLETLMALGRCHGIEDETVRILIDPGGDLGVPGVIDRWAANVPCPVEVREQHQHVGCNANTRDAMVWGFEDADYVILVEDDVTVMPDALRYFEWARVNRGTDLPVRLWAVCTLSFVPYGDDPGGVVLADNFEPWAWATWEDRFEQMLVAWPDRDHPSHPSWDIVVDGVRGVRPCVFPELSRAQNVGVYGGVHQHHPSTWAFDHVETVSDYGGSYFLRS